MSLSARHRLRGLWRHGFVARADDPAGMAAAFRHAVIGGRLAARSGRIPRREHALASSPMTGRPDL